MIIVVYVRRYIPGKWNACLERSSSGGGYKEKRGTIGEPPRRRLSCTSCLHGMEFTGRNRARRWWRWAPFPRVITSIDFSARKSERVRLGEFQRMVVGRMTMGMRGGLMRKRARFCRVFVDCVRVRCCCECACVRNVVYCASSATAGGTVEVTSRGQPHVLCIIICTRIKE